MINKRNCFEEDVKILQKMKKDFTIERSGSFTYLNYEGKRLQYGPDNHGGVTGAHLSKMVKRDVEKMVEFKQTDTYYHQDPPSVYVNEKNLATSINEYATQIDMRNCYWVTAYNQKIITRETFLRGLKKKEWKVGRNAAIGSLDKKIIVTYYRNGKEVDSERFLMHRNCRYARQKVITRVDEIALDVINKICPDHFLFFITDCFFVKSDRASDVKKYLSEIGYDYSEATVLVKHHFPQRRLIVWDKIETTKRADGKNVIKRERDKFIHYTSKSIIQ